MTKKFRLGRVSVTLDAFLAIEDSGQDANFFFERHARGDWGCGCAEINEASLATGGPLFSAYETLKGVRLWVVTDNANRKGKRTVTTIYLPDEFGKDEQ